jgi:dipeptidyl aminopeptidase/acylaminoacyl peptidase
MRKLYLLSCLFISCTVFAQDNLQYQQPPASILELALAAPPPSVKFSKNGEDMLILTTSSFPTVEELAQPELKLAGMRINPANFGLSRERYTTGITIKHLANQQQLPVTGLPADARIGDVIWSPSGKQIAFAVTSRDAITLWTASISTGVAHIASQRQLNNIWDNSYTWLDEERLLMLAVPANIGKRPEQPAAPKGPTVQQTSGKAAPAVTYQDLLKNPFDEQLFDYYFQSEPVIINGTAETAINVPGIYTYVSPSPDKQYLMVKQISKPYSYLVPAERFPVETAIWRIDGAPVTSLSKKPLDEVRPKGFDATSAYPRQYNWRADAPATIYWITALDGGDPKKAVPFRDAVNVLPAPFNGQGQVIAKTVLRYDGIFWGTGNTALLTEISREQQKVRTSRINPSDTSQPIVLLHERSSNDRYNDPGTPVLVPGQYGKPVLYISAANEILMTGEGASSEGDKPFLAAFNLRTGKSRILWRSQPPFYESVVQVINPEKLQVVTSKESNTTPVNYYLQELRKKTTLPLTNFSNPLAQLQNVQKVQLKYKRKDGVDLTAMLYLPAGYDKDRDGRLPVLMWAYPREYKSALDAAQVRGSQYRFIRIIPSSPLFWVTRGYAVMDATEMPIVGEGNQSPNDNFLPQLVMNAEAAVSKITSMGIGDSTRIAVGGHSYGAFMTANLLAHTRLFKAGIARSGAYNRTLTPFGFQNEQRTYWQAPEVYNTMSPFAHADKLKTPILLIHGEADNNSGTFPIQSERLYNAIKGNGGTARLVFLPFESHGYAAKENILHMLWEMDQWLEKYVKNNGQ